MAGRPQPLPYTDGVGRSSDSQPQQTWTVRRVSLQAVGRISLLFAICLWAVLVIASVLLWQAAGVTGLLENFESFWAEATGQESVSLNGSVLLWVVILGGLVLVAAITLLHVMFAMLFNSICDLTGGVPVGVDEIRSGPVPTDEPVTDRARAMRAPTPSFSARVSGWASELARKWPLQSRNR